MVVVKPLTFILLSRAVFGFLSHPPPQSRQRPPAASSSLYPQSSNNRVVVVASASSLASANDDEDATTTTTTATTTTTRVAMKASELDDSLGLTSEERAVVNVHRGCKDSVVYVTSVLSSSATTGGGGGRRRRSKRWGRPRGNESKSTTKRNGEEEDGKEEEENLQKLPRGMALGSGSGFVVDAEGYVVTNYHVVQRAYEANQATVRYEEFWDGLAADATRRMRVDSDLKTFINGTIGAFSGRESSSDNLPARVFVRFGTNGEGDTTGSGASYLPCEIVDVAKELDVAVLRIITKPSSSSSSSSLRAIRFGSSSDLLVGQSLLAIGNPFGLDRTLSSGLVSALGRSVTGVAGNEIKNCIQTDAAINPGNSGGPLLNLNGEVVGVNTMIISTSGSSAGIGFAVPGDDVRESAERILETDKERRARNGDVDRKGRGWLGADVATGSLEESLRRRLPLSTSTTTGDVEEEEDDDVVVAGAFLTSIATDSPLTNVVEASSIAGGSIRVGDRVVDVGGNCPIANGVEFVAEMRRRVEGEKLSLTVRNPDGERRVEYVTLGRIPL